MRRTPRTLIPNEGYELGWVKATPFFNQPLPPTVLPDGTVVPTATPGQPPSNEFPWVSRGHAIMIAGNINVNVPLILEDNYRNLIILQNNSIATSPDTAPNLFISLDGPVQFVTVALGVTFAYNAITLVPGEGLVLDTRVLGNALYFAWGSFINGGNTARVYGMCIYGRTLNSPPLQQAPVGTFADTTGVLSQRFNRNQITGPGGG
jgi:hypothetical protein